MTRGEVEILNIYLHGDSSQGAVSGIVDRELVSFSSFIQNCQVDNKIEEGL